MSEPVAVIGMACRFPQTPDPESLWNLLLDEREALSRFSDRDLARRGVPAGLRGNPHYVPVGGVIDDQETFDPAPFGIHAPEAEILDPQHRVFLECAWHALDDAGHGGGRHSGVVGVYAGAALSAYLITNLAGRFDPTGGADPTGNLDLHSATVADYLPLRTAYRLGLTGPAVSVGATCATSLVAVHLAVQALVAGECDTAIAGGVSLRVPQGVGYLYVPDGPFSRDGHTRPYSAGASGTVFTQGAGAVVLRRLSDAVRDGDPIAAVVLGSTVGNDGAQRVGFTAPSAHGQARTIAEALAVAGLEPGDISYVEGHGTGTPLGDPIEVQALRRVFGDSRRPWCALGSVKGNLGHADSAAGIAGFLKTVLALRHRTIPASRYAQEPHPDLPLDGSALRLAAQTQPWEPVAGGRRAGVSSFGIGGVNCHVVLTEAPDQPKPAIVDRRPQLLTVSAATLAACRAAADQLASHSDDGLELAEVAHTLATGRAAMSVRAAVAVAPGDDLKAALRRSLPVQRPGTSPRLVFGFPGGDAQYAGMARGLYADEPSFAATVDDLAKILTRLTGDDPRQVLLADPVNDQSRAAARAPRTGLPAGFTAAIATARLLEAYGVEPDLVLGHSVGEYAAAVAAGALTAADAAELVAERSLRMAELPPGGMLAVDLSESELESVLAQHPELELAAVNGPRACVLSGPEPAIREAAQRLTGQGRTARVLAVATAGHSQLVEPALPALRARAAGLTAKQPVVPLVSTVSGEFADEVTLSDPEHWVRHLRAPVRFDAALSTALAGGPAIVVQVGPGATIASLAAQRGQHAVPATLTTFPAADDPTTPGRIPFLETLGQLWCHGFDVDTGALSQAERRVRLPGYPFQRRRFWVPAPSRRGAAPAVGPVLREPEPTEPLQLPTWRQLPPAATPGDQLAGSTWLVWGDPESAQPILAALRAAGATASAGSKPSSRSERVDGVVWLVESGGETGPGADPQEAVAARVQAAGRVAAALQAREPDLGTVALLQVTVAGERVTGDERLDPVAGAARALPRVLAQETPGLQWRTLDLPEADWSPATVAAVLAEAADLLSSVPDLDLTAQAHGQVTDSGTGEDSGNAWELACRGGKRWLRQWQPWRPAPSESGLPPDPVVVIVGGLGNAGLALTEQLCRCGAAEVVLAGRSGEPDPGATEPRLARRRETLARLRRAGGRIVTETLDATDSAAVTDLLHRVGQRRGRIDLLVHAPVQIELTPLSELDHTATGSATQAVDAVLAGKVAGTLALRAALERMPETLRPRTVLLMSSAAGTIGGFGLGPYVAASRFLDAMAQQGGPEPSRWLAVDWDRWRFGTDEERAAVAEITMRHALDADQAVTTLLRLADLAATGACPPQVAASPADLNPRSVLLPGRTAPAPGVTGSTGAELRTPAERLVAQVWSDLLGQPVTSGEDDFFGLGGHSLLATRVLAVLRDHHGVELSLRDLLARPTVAGLAALISDTGAPPPATVDAPPAAGPAIGSEAPSTLTPPPQGTGETSAPEPFPLTRVQHAYWVGRSEAYALGGVGCHFYYEHDCDQLDLERFETAWNIVITRHPMLRTVITAEGHNLTLPEVPRYRIPVRDCRTADNAEQERVIAEVREWLSHRVASPDRWPLVEIHAVALPEGRVRLAWSVDVLVCDSASFLILDRELATLYSDPDAELPPVRVSFADCVAALADRERDPAYQRAADYWRERLETLPGPPALPAGSAPGKPRFARRRAELDPAQWRRLRERAAERGVTPTAVLLAAYADALAEWAGQDHFCVTLTLFDRPEIHPDVNRVVGEFSSLLLLEYDRRGRPDLLAQAEALQQRLFADLDHRLFSGLSVLAERSRHTGAAENVPVVFTGMLGLERLSGEPAHDHDWLGPVVYGVSQTPQVWLDHQAFELRDHLVLQWDVNESVLDPIEVDAAFGAYLDRLHRLTELPIAEVTSLPLSTTGPAITEKAPTKPHSLAVLATVWGELLGLPAEQIRPGDTFLNLGGDSLLAVRMAAMLRARLGVNLPLPQVRPTLTLAELSDLVASRPTGATGDRGVQVRLDRRLDREAPFGLLPLQQAYFVGQQGGWELSYPSVHTYTDIRLFDVDADAAPAALADAVARVVSHQPMLRARLLPDGTQVILAPDDPSVHNPVKTLDLRRAGPDEVARRLAQLRAEATERGPDPTTGPGYEVRLTLLPGGEGRLHVSWSLLICDGWSGAVFDREMFDYIANSNTVLPPLLVDFGDYVAAMARLRETDQWRADWDWWRERVPQLPPAPAVPTVADPERVHVTSMGSRETRLDPADWRRLREQCRRRNVTPAAVLATAYAIGLARLTGQRRFLLTSLQFNRLPLHPDVDRMIGPFSATTLLPVELPATPDLAGLATAVQQQIADALAHNLVSGVEVARELGRWRGTQRPVAPVVFQSTLGLDQALGGDLPHRAGPLGGLNINDYYQQVRTPQVWLECRVFELRDELVINFAVVEELFADGVIDELFTQVTDLVRALVEDRGWDSPVPLPEPGPESDHSAPATPAAGTDSGPLDRRERELARHWLAALGQAETAMGSVRRDTDFFAAGGDSLLAVRLLGRLASAYGRRVAQRDFLARPTLGGLAGLVWPDSTTGTDDTILVPLREGTGDPLFLLHPSGGDVVCYVELARALTVDAPVLALSDPGLSGAGGPADIPAMVDEYLAVIRRHHPTGPYLLGGWSMGGTVAHQVAVELHRQGHRVALLAMVDSNSPDRIVAIEGLDAPATREQMWHRYLRSIASFLDAGAEIGEAPATLERWLREQRLLGPDEASTRTRFEVFARHLDALATHTAQPLPTDVPVLLLRAAQPSPHNARIGMGVDDAFDEPDLGWGPYVTGELTVRPIPAHHYSILRAPAVARVASELSDAYRRVI